jgi:ferredoxin
MNPMSDKLFSKKKWIEALESLNTTAKVFVPVSEGDYHAFKPFEEGMTPDFTFQNTRLSPKALVFPQSERMFEYSLDPEDENAHILEESPKEYPPQVIMGIRPCDAYAFELVKVNFDSPEFRDPWWVKRFEATTLIGLGCNDPCASCFCTSVGTGPFSDKGLDALLYDLGDNVLVSPRTAKGEALLQDLKDGGSVDEKTRKEAEHLAAAALEKIDSKVPVDKLSEKIVTDLFDAPFWDEVAFSCINCGTCTFLCPTCWCFDIQDEVLGKQGDRIRNWDACMFPLFTLHGSGHNPRDKKTQRVRQRFMHKLKYYVDKYKAGAACVGCGRCVQFCPVNIDIRRVFDLVNNF